MRLLLTLVFTHCLLALGSSVSTRDAALDGVESFVSDQPPSAQGGSNNEPMSQDEEAEILRRYSDPSLPSFEAMEADIRIDDVVSYSAHLLSTVAGHRKPSNLFLLSSRQVIGPDAIYRLTLRWTHEVDQVTICNVTVSDWRTRQIISHSCERQDGDETRPEVITDLPNRIEGGFIPLKVSNVAVENNTPDLIAFAQAAIQQGNVDGRRWYLNRILGSAIRYQFYHKIFRVAFEKIIPESGLVEECIAEVFSYIGHGPGDRLSYVRCVNPPETGSTYFIKTYTLSSPTRIQGSPLSSLDSSISRLSLTAIQEKVKGVTTVDVLGAETIVAAESQVIAEYSVKKDDGKLVYCYVTLKKPFLGEMKVYSTECKQTRDKAWMIDEYDDSVDDSAIRKEFVRAALQGLMSKLPVAIRVKSFSDIQRRETIGYVVNLWADLREPNGEYRSCNLIIESNVWGVERPLVLDNDDCRDIDGPTNDTSFESHENYFEVVEAIKLYLRKENQEATFVSISRAEVRKRKGMNFRVLLNLVSSEVHQKCTVLLYEKGFKVPLRLAGFNCLPVEDSSDLCDEQLCEYVSLDDPNVQEIAQVARNMFNNEPTFYSDHYEIKSAKKHVVVGSHYVVNVQLNSSGQLYSCDIETVDSSRTVRKLTHFNCQHGASQSKQPDIAFYLPSGLQDTDVVDMTNVAIQYLKTWTSFTTARLKRITDAEVRVTSEFLDYKLILDLDTIKGDLRCRISVNNPIGNGAALLEDFCVAMNRTDL